jgi:Ca2+-binding RTX toxin-like protein
MTYPAASFTAGDYNNSGKFLGSVRYGTDFSNGLPILSFSQIENLQFTGTAFNDQFDLAISNSSWSLGVDFDGGEGNDRLSFNFSALTSSFSFVVDDETITSSFGTFVNFENFVIRAGAGDDVIHTGSGNDVIETGAGSNEVFAGSGHDSITTQGGIDTIDGGVGTDNWTGDYATSTAALTVDLGATIAVSNGTTVINVEGAHVTTGSGDDRFNVTGVSVVVIEGGAGYDILNHAIVDTVPRDFTVTGQGTLGSPGTPSSLSGQIRTYTSSTDSTSFSGIERAVFKGGTNDDLFQLSGVFAPSAIDFDGGGGFDLLRANFEALPGASTFTLQPGGTIVSNRGAFANFYSVWLTGGGGNDVFTTQEGDDQLNGGGGDDILNAGAAEDVLNGGSGADSRHGVDVNDELNGGTGNDLLDGGSGDDLMTGGTGSDVYVVDSAGDVVNENAAEGTDEVRTSLASASLADYANVENLTGTSAAGQTLTGNSGNNVVTGGSGADTLRLYDGGNDTANGGAGNDNIFFIGSLTSADVVNGGDGVDTLVLQGPYGALTLSPNVTQIENISILGGGNTNFGEPGTNRYDYVLTTHDANFAAGVQARINGSALLVGEDFTFDGSAETNASFVVYGGNGKDTLTGGLGNDIFFLAEDRFASGDTVNGGSGYDGMFLRGNYTIDFNAPGYTGLFTSIENLTLTSATDERYARGGGSEFDYSITLSNALVGAGSVLTVSGTILTASETMILDGSLESDGALRLFGGKAGDTLKGGGQADILHGNLGADTLAGGGGADMFRYDSTAESNMASLDQILDFTAGTDKIDLSRIDAWANLTGDQAFSWIGSNAFSGTAGQLRAYQDGASWFVEGDTNGDSVADLVIALTLQGPTPLGASDFLL